MTDNERQAALGRLMEMAAALAPDVYDRAGILLALAGWSLADSAWPREPTEKIRIMAQETLLKACYARRAALAQLVAACEGQG